MHTLTLPGGSITLHDSAYTLPEYRRSEYTYYALIHSAIGSSLNDLDKHFKKIALLAQAGETDAVAVAAYNGTYLIYNLQIGQIPADLLALCCLVESVEGVAWTDFSPKGVEELARKLSKLGIHQELISDSETIYAEIIEELQYAYPKYFPDKTEEVNSRAAQALLLQIDETLNPDDSDLPERRKNLEYELIESIKPPKMAGKPTNALDTIRDAYRETRNALKSEWPDINDQLPATEFWGFVKTLESRQRPNPPRKQPEE